MSERTERDASRDRLLERLAKIETEERQINNDLEHWNSTHPNEEPIPLEDWTEIINVIRGRMGLPLREVVVAATPGRGEL